jgi:uncharacterized protein (TIGR03435 family)
MANRKAVVLRTMPTHAMKLHEWDTRLDYLYKLVSILGGPERCARLNLRLKALFIAVGLMSLTATAVFGQGASVASPDNAKASYVPTLTFDVASVRESPQADSYMVSGGFAAHTSDFRVTNWSFLNLIISAFGVQHYQVVGLPNSWAMFNVQAKADATADEKLAKLSKEDEMLEQQHMLQALLADRFKLKTHWETREGQVYNLVVAKNGPKMLRSTGAPSSAEEQKVWGDRPVPALYQRGSSMSGFDLVGHGCSMERLTETLAGQFGRPVLDKTGLSGTYDFTLSYLGRFAEDRRDGDTNPRRTLDEAIQDLLGLKVELGKGPIQVLIVDHIEKPSEN